MNNLQVTITIPFQFPPEDHSYTTLVKCYTFWDLPSTIEFFKRHGYTLYKRKEPEYEDELEPYMYPVLECPPSGEADYPFPHYDSGRIDTSEPHRAGKLLGAIHNGRLVFAQETRSPSHHVVIKLIATDSEEHRILTFLQSQGLKVLEQNCLVPVLDILPNGPYSFVVMPRWGNYIYYPEGGPIRNGFRIMHSLLKVRQEFGYDTRSEQSKALAFLHRHNILHRDIKVANVLVNHFSPKDDTFYRKSGSRMGLQRADELKYCLFDFDISMMLPPDTDRTRYRLPYQESWLGTGWQTHDTSQGEFDYDPFAFDVGNLGVVFCDDYQHLCRRIPMLAPFLDRMTTRDIPKRFSAAEALEFFENFLPEISADVLNKCYRTDPEARETYDVYDRWRDLSPEFIKEWESYREPRIPIGTAFLRWLCSHNPMYNVVPVVRSFFYRVTCLGSRIFSLLCS